jgi:RNA polymerase sigma-70 factor (ECF subfamily)
MVTIPMQKNSIPTTEPEALTLQAALTQQAALIKQAVKDPQAFGVLYESHFERVYRYHLARSGNPAEAQDLTTLTFVAALENLVRFRGTGSFSAWLFGIARRQAAMYFRSRRREVELDAAMTLADTATLPEILAGQRLEIAQVTAALEIINPERREAILLCLFSQLTAEEAGQVMGKSPSAVKMLLWRGVRDLRELFASSQEAIA